MQHHREHSWKCALSSYSEVTRYTHLYWTRRDIHRTETLFRFEPEASRVQGERSSADLRAQIIIISLWIFETLPI